MKKTISVYAFSLLFTIFILAIAGCSKDKDNNTDTPQPDCVLTAINPSSGAAATFSYDEEGRIISITELQQKTTLVYNGKTISVSVRNNAENLTGSRLYQLNEAGLPTSITIYKNPSGTVSENYTYQYDSTRLKKIVISNSSNNKVQNITYTWENGNAVREDYEGIITTYSYYTDQPVNNDGYLEISNLLNGHIVHPIRNKNRVKSREFSGFIEEYSYIINSLGKVEAIKRSVGSDHLISLHWDCK